MGYQATIGGETRSGRAAADAIRANRAAIAQALAAPIIGWAKYAPRHAAIPAGFAEEEKGASVDYLAGLLATGDETFRHLLIGERIKQFYLPDQSAAEIRALKETVFRAEREGVIEALGKPIDPAVRAAIEQAFDAVDAPLLAEAGQAARILFVGDCLFLDVVGFLAPACLEQGILLEPWFVASKDPADQRAQVARHADKAFDLVFYSPLTYEAAPAWERLLGPRAALLPAERLQTMARAAAAPAAETIALLAQLFECNVFVHDAAAIRRHDTSVRDRLKQRLTRRARGIVARAASAAIDGFIAAANARSIPHVFRFTEEELVAELGDSGAGQFLHRAFLQHPAAFGRAVAARYAELVFVHLALMKRKLVVCDLDNTLWDGVIGEGLGVRHHGDRQAILQRLKAKGVLLAINSKNDREKVVWDDGGLLCADDFVSSQINWDPKVTNIRRIAEHLNLKPKDFVFIDDRADERALVGESFPGLLPLDALDMPTWRALSLWADYLPHTATDRTLFYRQRDERREYLESEIAASAEESRQAFIQLNLVADVHEAGDGELARVVELINRTNQFNMTGSRVTHAEIAAAAADPATRIIVAAVSDRFGEMGLVSVLIASQADGVISIPHFVLSCRVFGYGVEQAMLTAVRALGPQPIAGSLIPTPFNAPCQSVYPDNGFTAAGSIWTLAADAAPSPAPEWLRVSGAVPPFDDGGSTHQKVA